MSRPIVICVLLSLCCLITVGGPLTASAAGSGEKHEIISPESVTEITADLLIDKIAAEKGKIVVVNVFAAWCPPCREEVPGLIAVRKEFSKDTLVLIGVSIDKDPSGQTKPGSVPKPLVHFMNEMSFNYPVYLAGQDFERKVGVTAVPQLLIYDKEGMLVVNHKGYVDQKDLSKAIKALSNKK